MVKPCLLEVTWLDRDHMVKAKPPTSGSGSGSRAHAFTQYSFFLSHALEKKGEPADKCQGKIAMVAKWQEIWLPFQEP